MSCAGEDTRLKIRYNLFFAQEHSLGEWCACAAAQTGSIEVVRRRALAPRLGVLTAPEEMVVVE